MSDNSFYIEKVNDEVVPILYTKTDVYTRVTENYAIAPRELLDSTLNVLNYYRTEVILVKAPELETIPDTYLTAANLIILDLLEVDNTYIVKLQAQIDEVKINYEWKKIRDIRDTLLAETDWMEVSPLINEEDKLRIKAYRTYLRNIPQFFTYPCDVVWIDKPIIIISKEINSDLYLDDEDFEVIKNYNDALNSNDWNTFLVQWSYTKFNRSKILVDLLLTMYTGYKLNNIINHSMNILDYEALN